MVDYLYSIHFAYHLHSIRVVLFTKNKNQIIKTNKNEKIPIELEGLVTSLFLFKWDMPVICSFSK